MLHRREPPDTSGGSPHFIEGGAVRFTALIWVVAGGAAGTALRAALAEVLVAEPGAWPWATFVVNLVGSLALGGLVGVLADRRSERARTLRLALGTGLLGGFTTYSAFAVETYALLADGHWTAGLGYPLASAVLGVGAAACGVALGRRRAAEDDR